ncbi:MAG: hypothetical protein IAF38_19850, partial [Bacteroidia bacterium]|nr:hypothetical protein [Bacteroidia bacterium]
MKRILFFLALFTPFAFVFSQQVLRPITPEDYDQLKSTGKLDPAVKYMVTTPKSAIQPEMLQKAISPLPKPDTTSGGACTCIVPLDPSFTIAPFQQGTAPDYRNDDGSTNSIALPFTFCMYGVNYNTIFINNNGNVSFVSSSGVFSSTGFPNNTDIMIAPFWTDVDTRNLASGLVYYKTTPTSMIVKWENVGYYSQHVDKLCTFQLIITDGSDPILPIGKNIAFCYGDMNWTT